MRGKKDELKAAVTKAKLAGSYMAVVWSVQDGKVEMFRLTDNFPLGDIPVALDMLKAPATRLMMYVSKVGTKESDRTGRFMEQRGKPARLLMSGPNQPTTYRITVFGRGENLPANFELEVWERWMVNGKVPPLSWAE